MAINPTPSCGSGSDPTPRFGISESVRPVTAPAAKTYRSQEHPLRNRLLETILWNWNVFLQTLMSSARFRVVSASQQGAVYATWCDSVRPRNVNDRGTNIKRFPPLVRFRQLHNQLGSHVQEREGTGDVLFLEQPALGCLVTRALEID